MNLHAAAAYARHMLTARSTAGHGVHSPFMFRFITEVIGGRTDRAITREIESLRMEMLSDRRVVQVRDLGAGSVVMKERVKGTRRYKSGSDENSCSLRGGLISVGERSSQEGEPGNGGYLSIRQNAVQVRERKIREIASVAAVPKRNAALLARIAGSLDKIRSGLAGADDGSGEEREAVILELGTSLGISTLALALGAPHRRVISVEGCPELAAIARQNLQRHGAQNAEVLCMEFGEALDHLRNRGTKTALAFIDGNHRGATLIEYVHMMREMGEEMIIIADDIHMNRDMIIAWRSVAEGAAGPASGTFTGNQLITGSTAAQPTTGETDPAYGSRPDGQHATGKIAVASLETLRMGMLFCLRNLTPGHYRVR